MSARPAGESTPRGRSKRPSRARRWRIGVISDTHGLLRPEAVSALEGSDLIVHAGDIGSAEVLETLSRIAPVHKVRGNVDRGQWASELPETAAVEVGDLWLWLLHDATGLDLDPVESGFAAVIAGHSHRPSLRSEGGVMYLNPGSAGPRRFSLPVSVARLEVRGAELQAELLELSV
jgi:putative phosphoesterase